MSYMEKMSKKPELDKEPEISKSGFITNKKRKLWKVKAHVKWFWKKDPEWITMGRYETEERAKQAVLGKKKATRGLSFYLDFKIEKNEN